MDTLALPQPATLPDCPEQPKRTVAQTILIVDDDSYMRAFLRVALERAGYVVLAAADGEEAGRCAQEPVGIDLLVSDLELGQSDGREVAHALKSARPGLRVLFLSGYPKGDSGYGPLADDVDFLAKPFRLKELGEKVREILTRPAELA